MGSRDYVITLVLKARDEIAGAVGKALAEVEGLNKLSQKNGFKDLDADAERLSNTLRTKLNSALSEVRGNLNRTEADADKFERRYKSLGHTAEETGKKFKKFDIDETGRKLRRAETDAKTAGDELERLGKRTSKNSDEWDRMSSRLDKANSRIDQHSSKLKEAEKTASELMKVTGQLNKLEGEHERTLERTRSSYDKQVESVAKLKVARDRLAMNPLDREKVDFKSMDREIDEERRKAAELGAEVEALGKLHPTINIDLDKGHFDEEASKLEAEKTIIGKDVHVNVDMDIGGAEAKLIAFDALKKRSTGSPSKGSTSLLGWFNDVGQAAESNSHSIAAFDNSLRGLAILAAIAFAQPLLTIMTALGGELIAVASSAIVAGSALGGALVAGISQALPVAGLLVASLARVGAVIAAFKQTETMKQQETYKGEKQEGQQISAEEGVVNATEAVTAARQNLRLAEVALTKARFEARRGLQDLILQEKQAELAAKGAALSQFEAQMTLRQAISSGSISEVAGAQLEVANAKLSSRQSSLNAGRARQDLHLQEQGSPLGPNQGVPDAERQVEQSIKALKQSERAAGAAKRSAEEAATQGLASAGKLNAMLGELDKAEKRLYGTARKLYSVYKEVMRPITDVIVNSFNYAANKGIELLKNPQFSGAFESLAQSMAGNFKRITDEFNSPSWIKFFSTMTKEAGQNMGPLTSAFISMSRAFRSIAEASAPILHDIVEWIREGSKGFEEWVGKGKGLREFFREGEKALEAWLALTGALVRLFLALIGVSAKEGTSQVESLTDRINEATKYIETHQKKVEGFFHQVGEVMSVLGQVLLALGQEILRAFNVKSVKQLGNIVVKVLIPALGEAIRMFGRIAEVLSGIANNPAGGFMLKFVGSIFILKAVLSPFISVLKGAVIQISKIGQMAAGLALSLTGVSTEAIAAHGAFDVLKARLAGYSAEQIGAAEAGAPLMASLEGVAAAGAGVSATMLAIPLAIAAVIAAFIYLSDKFGVLDDEWAALKEAGEGFVEPIIGPFEDLIKQIDELLEALGILGGGAKGLGKIFEVYFVKYVKGIFIPAIKTLGNVLKGVGENIAGVINIISGTIEIITGVLTLNFGKIEDGAKKIVKGLLTPFVSAFNLIKREVGIWGESLRELFGGIFHWLIHKASGIPGALGDAFSGLIHIFGSLGGKALHAIISGFSSVWGWIKRLPDKLENAGESIAKSFARGVTRLPKLLAEGFEGASAFIGKIAGDITKYINDHTPFGDDIDVGLFSIHLPNLPEHFERGGPVGRGIGTNDDQLGLLTRGEHVLTTDDVRNAGGHQAIFSWRRSLGGRGGQSSGGAYAEGGEVKATKQEGQAAVGLEALLSMILNFGGEALEAWDNIWGSLQHRTAVGVKAASNKFDELEKSMIQSSKRINTLVVKNFDRTLTDVRGDINQLTNVVFQGMDYIVNATNKSLSMFGAKKVDLNLQRPKDGGKGKAEGGFLGQPGERGADGTAYIPAGRGEAVLNWAHQKVVNPALRMAYGFGLPELFQKVKGEHAGGTAGGYAGGGYVFPFNNQWTWGRTDMGVDFAPSSTGAPIAAIGDAKILGTGAPGWPGGAGGVLYQLLNGPLAKKIIYVYESVRAMVKAGQRVSAGQLIGSGFTGGTGIETGFADSSGSPLASSVYSEGDETIWGKRMDEFLHHLSGGGDIASFGGAISDRIKKLKLKGDKGSLKSIAEGSLEKVRKAANKYLSKHFGNPSGRSRAIKFGGGEGSLSPLAWAKTMIQAGFPRVAQIIAEGLGTLSVESNFNASEQGGAGGASGHIGGWQESSAFGSVAQRLNPLASTIAAYNEWRRSKWNAWWPFEGSETGADRAGRYLGVATQAVKHFATGGVVSGKGGDGSPTPILAHLGEWILNPRQQLRVAKLMGTTVDKLKGMLGFSGGPTSFAGGGEPKSGGSEGPSVGAAHPVTALPIPNLENYNTAIKYYLEQVNKELKRGVTGVGKKRKNLSDFIAKLFTRISKQLEEFKNNWEILSQKLTISLAKANVQLGKGGKILGRKLQPDQILNLEIKQLYAELGYLLSQHGPIVKALRLAQKTLRKAKKEGDIKAEQVAEAAIKNARNELRENEVSVAESRQKILEKREQRETEHVSKIGEEAEHSTGQRTNQASIETARGFGERANALAASQVPIWEEEKGQLQKALAQAKRSHNQALASQIEGEIEQLEVSISEAAAALIQQASEDIETRATRAKFGIELGNRMADVREHYGYLPQRQEERGGLIQQERGVVSTQMVETQALLAKAMAEGFGPDVIIPLQEKVADLNVQLEENAAAIYANTIAIRQAYIEQIQERQSFIGGVYGTLETIVNGLGALSGILNSAKLVELIAAAGKQLGSTSEGLRGQFGSFVGERLAGTSYGETLMALSGLHGEELVAAVQNLNFTAIEEFLGPGSEAEKQFQALIQAIIENEAAVIENTKQLEEALGQNQIQSFTSTAWQWFRSAIFTGMGNLMPEYAKGTPFYEAATGGEMLSDGHVKLHRGELIIPNHFSTILRSLARAGALATTMSSGSIPATPLGSAIAGAVANSGSAQLAGFTGGGAAAELAALRQELARRTQEINVEVNEAEPTDPTYLSNRIAFAAKTPAI